MSKNNYINGSLFTGKVLEISETAVSGMIASYLDARQIYNDRLNSGMARIGRHFVHLCKTGTPDRFCIIAGRIIFIEVKSFGQKATAEQLTRHAELRSSGAIVMTADSFDKFEREFKIICDELKSTRQTGIKI